MFLISTIAFLLATVIALAEISNISIIVYTVLVKHRDLYLVRSMSLMDTSSGKIGIMLAWMSDIQASFPLTRV